MSNSLDDEHIGSGLWREHSSGRLLILVKEDTAVVISIAVALALTLSLPRAMLILKWIILPRLKSKRHAARTPRSDQDTNINLNHIPMHTVIADKIAKSLAKGSTPEQVFVRLLTDYVTVTDTALPHSPSASTTRRARNKILRIYEKFRTNILESTILLAIACSFLAIFVGTQVVALFANQIIGSNMAYSTSPHSGAWFTRNFVRDYNRNASIAPTYSSLHNRNWRKAMAYADNCYKDNPRKDDCSALYRPRLNYNETHDMTCPFEAEMCSGLAFGLDTGFIDANLLGINDRYTCQFRIRRTCSPLVTADQFVQSWSAGDQGLRYVEYSYGRIWGLNQSSNITHNETVYDYQYPSDDFGSYYVKEVPGDAIANTPELQRWIPQLEIPGSKVSLYFIRPVNLVFYGPSNDPIFPVTVPTIVYNATMYRYPHLRSTVLGCADTLTIRDPNRPHVEWNVFFQNDSNLRQIESQNPSVSSSLHLVNMSYLLHAYYRPSYNLIAMHLEASRRIIATVSDPIDSQQWKIEVKKMFDAQLALLQLTVRGLATGFGFRIPGVVNALDHYGESVNGKILFPAPGRKNIKVAELMVFVTVIAGLWIFTAHTGEVLWVRWLWEHTGLCLWKRYLWYLKPESR